MGYTPFQAWVTEGVLKTPSVFRRPKSSLTDYDPVHAGNVVPGEVDVTDPGQLGRSNLPTLHAKSDVRDTHLAPMVPDGEALTSLIPRFTRFVWLRGGTYNPFMFTDMDSNSDVEYVAQTAIGAMPFSPVGTVGHSGDPGEHGPITVDELEAGLNVRQPRRLRQRSLLRTLLFLPGKDLDQTGSRDERVLPATGREETDEDRLSAASVGTGITFTIPDVRRTFDQPKDAGKHVPRDSDGNPLYRKAGYQLIATSQEPIPHDVITSHAFPNFNDLTELPVGDPVNRVRAGVQYDWKSTRPATMPHWFDVRPFDQLIAHGNLALKGQVKPPSASRPIMTNEDYGSNDRWSAGRRYTMPPAGMTATAVLPNIDRQPPQSWDSSLYLESPSTVDNRAASWRLT
jgi:hypothetical protein